MKIFILLLSCLFAAAAPNQQWPQFRGPNGQGVADGCKPPTHFGPTSNVLFKVKAPAGLSSPVIWGDRLFLTAFENEQLLTLAFDAKSGRELWRRTVSAKKIEPCHTFSSPAASTPCTDGERVFAYFGSYGITAFDLDGKEIWSRPFENLPTQYGTASSPIVHDGRVYLQRDGDSTNSVLVALDAKTGKTVWEAARPLARASYATPVIWQHDGTEEVVLRGCGRLAAYAPQDGKELWWVNGWGFACVTSAAVSDKMLFAGGASSGDPGEPPDPVLDWDDMIRNYDANKDGQFSGDELPNDVGLHLRKEIPKDAVGNFISLRFIGEFADSNHDGKVTREEWNALNAFMMDRQNIDKFVAVRPGGKGDISKSGIAWETARGLSEMPSPLFYRDRLYLVRDGSMLTIFEPESGKRLADQERFGAASQYVASPVAANGYLYLVSEPGVCTVLRAGDKAEVVAVNKLGENARCTPSIAGDRLYVRTLEHLWAFAQKP